MFAMYAGGKRVMVLGINRNWMTLSKMTQLTNGTGSSKS